MISHPSDYPDNAATARSAAIVAGKSTEPQRPEKESHEAHARQSPLKTPETETAHANLADVGAAAAKQNSGALPSDAAVTARGSAAGKDAKSDTKWMAPSARPRQYAVLPEDVYPPGIDVDNDKSSDSTLDTDGKDHDAKRLGRMDDSEVVSNASADNAIPTPPSGLAGVDSRRGGNRPAILAERGASVTYKGFVEDTGLYATAGDGDDEEVLEKHQEHLPPNHARVGQRIQIMPKSPD
jgi:hypothetical protein